MVAYVLGVCQPSPLRKAVGWKDAFSLFHKRSSSSCACSESVMMQS